MRMMFQLYKLFLASRKVVAESRRAAGARNDGISLCTGRR